MNFHRSQEPPEGLGCHAGGHHRRCHRDRRRVHARQAYEQGFNVTRALDAMTDLRPEAHDCSVRDVFPRLGETGTAQDIIDLFEAKRV